jgi:hypothetical protein
MTLRFVASASVIGLALLTGCISTLEPAPPPPGAQQAVAPKPKVGDYWEYMVRDAYSGSVRGLYRYTVSRADPDRLVVDLTRDGQRVDTYIYTPDLKGLEHPLRNLQRLRYDPPYPAYAFPMYPGQRWRTVVTSTDPATGKSYRTHIHVSVGAWRRIKVPAGEFEALEVKRSVYAGNVESSDCRRKSSKSTGSRRPSDSQSRAKVFRATSTHRAAPEAAGIRRCACAAIGWLPSSFATR